MKNARIFLTILMVLSLNVSAWSQDQAPGFKTWGATSLQLRLNKKWSINASQLTAFNTGPFDFQFLQANLGVSRRIAKRWNIDLGGARSWFKTSNGVRKFNRVFAEVDFKQKWGNWGMKHSVRAEYHFPQLRKWRSRYIYSNKISYRFKKLPLRPQPYIRNQIYWYQGGRNVNYYANGEGIGESEFDEEDEDFEEEEFEPGEVGELIASQAPNGFHRYRFSAGVRMRFKKGIYGTIFYIWQREFNLPFGIGENRALNVPNENGNIQAPFNNFSLIGFSLSFTLKLY